MKFPYFIAKRFSGFASENGTKKPPGIKIAIFGIAIGMAVMLLAFAIVVGFKNEVSNQIIGVGSHIQIMAYNSGMSFDKSPVSLPDNILEEIKNVPNVQKIEKIVTKPGIIKTDTLFQGVVFKGVDNDYSWKFLKKNLVDGEIIDYNLPENKNKVLISKFLADALTLKTGDNLNAYFFQKQIRARKFEIAGIYSTSFSEFDKMFVISNLEPIRVLNGWDSTQISTLEIMLTDIGKISIVDRLKIIFDNFNNLSFTDMRNIMKITKLDVATEDINAIVGTKFTEDGFLYNTLTIKELYINIFSWLNMLDINVWVILVLMIIVAGFNMISGLLILILERTQTIGILKALGTKNSEIRKIFLLHALFFVLKGMFWGNVFGIGLAAIQRYTHIINFLNPEYYYVTFVPISLSIWTILMINFCVLFSSILMLLLPSHIITKILPAKAIRFE